MYNVLFPILQGEILAVILGLTYPGYQRSERGWGEREREKGGPLVTRAVNLTFMSTGI